MSDGMCLPGNSGFPINISGINNDIQINKQPNDIRLQFPPKTIYTFNQSTYFYDVPGSHTFFIGATQYNLSVIQGCKPSNTGIELKTPNGEIRFWGIPTANSASNTDRGVLIIPTYYDRDSSTNDTTKKLLDFFQGREVSLANIIPSNQKVIRYTTCVEIKSNEAIPIKNITIAVAHWRQGIGIPLQDYIPSPNSIVSSPSIPRQITLGFPTYSRMDEVGTPAKKTVQDTLKDENHSVPYVTTISASSSNFAQRFSELVYEAPRGTGSTVQTEYKCIALDRNRDIVKGKIVIDPMTGKRLDKTLAEEAADNAALDNNSESAISPDDLANYAVIVFGSIGGTILLAIVLYWLRRFFTRQTQTELVEAAAAAATLAQAPAVEWVDLLLPIFFGVIIIATLTITVTSIISSYKNAVPKIP